MKKLITLFFVVAICVSCTEKNDYKTIKSALSTDGAVSLEQIEVVRQTIIETKGLTSEQVSDLQMALSDYILVCAEQEAAKFETAFQQVYSHWSDASEMSWKIDSLDNAMEQLHRYGIQMYRSEGNIESSVSPLFVAEPFWFYLTKAEQELVMMQQVEFDRPSLEDEGLAISYQEVSDRLAKYDALCVEFATDSNYSAFESMRLFYLSLLIFGVDNSQVFDWDTEVLNPEVKATIFNHIAEHPYTRSSNELKQFIDILKKSKYKKTEQSDIFVTGTLKN